MHWNNDRKEVTETVLSLIFPQIWPHGTEQTVKFHIKGFFSKCDQIRWKPQETADLVIFTEEILNEKLHFCAVWYFKMFNKRLTALFVKSENFPENWISVNQNHYCKYHVLKSEYERFWKLSHIKIRMQKILSFLSSCGNATNGNVLLPLPE